MKQVGVNMIYHRGISSITHQESNIVNATFRKLNSEIRERTHQVGAISVPGGG